MVRVAADPHRGDADRDGEIGPSGDDPVPFGVHQVVEVDVLVA